MPLIPILTGCLIISVSCLLNAEFSGKSSRIYLFKPLSTLLIVALIGFSFLNSQLGTGFKLSILVGMLFCLGGDIALMFESARAFMIGLVLFLIGHVVYTGTFLHFGGYHWLGIVETTAVTCVSLAVVIFLFPGLKTMKVPVIFYVLVISLMVNCALLTFKSDFFSQTQARYLSLGAILFYISDVILAINRFRFPFRLNRISLAFYFAGQYLIALSTHYVTSL